MQKLVSAWVKLSAKIRRKGSTYMPEISVSAPQKLQNDAKTLKLFSGNVLFGDGECASRGLSNFQKYLKPKL